MTTYKKSKTIKEYKVHFKGYKLTVPIGATVSNKTSVDCDDWYHFWIPKDSEIEKITGFKDSILKHDIAHYGVNVPEEFCKPYEKEI